MARLGDICTISSSNAPIPDNRIWLLNLDMVEQQTGSIISYNYVGNDDLNSSIIQFDTDNVLYSKLRPNLNKVVIPDRSGFATSEMLPLKPNASVLCREYLAAYLRSDSFVSWAVSKTAGAKMPRLGTKVLLDKEIPLPSLEEQRRISTVLDKVSDLIVKRRSQLDKLDLLVKARFGEMFGDQYTNPKGWETGTIRDVVSEVKYGTSRPAVEGGAYKYLRMGNITFDGHLDLNDLKYIDIPESEIEKCIVKKGDVLFNRTNSKELVGKTCVFDIDEPMVIAGYIIRVRVNKRVFPDYLSAVLNSQYGKRTLADMCKAIVGQANINAQELQSIAILIPPIELQRQFSQFVSQVNKLASNINCGLDKLEILKKALMQQYFG